MSWDEKHINKSLTDHAYVFIILNFKNIKIFDMVSSRHKKIITKYFLSFPKESRDKVKYITMDMWEPYKDVALQLFRNAKIAIDSFHVMTALNNAIIKIRTSVMQKYNLKTEELDDNDPYYYVLKKYKYYLVEEFDNITNKRFYNKKLKMWLDKHSLRKYILDIDESLSKAYWLVTRYRELNKTATIENVKEQYIEIVDELYNSKIEPLVNVAKTLSTWQEYILNSFITIDDAVDSNGKVRRLSNGPIEGINSQIQKINLNGNGYTNFWRFRNRCIYVINKDYTILGTPKIKKKK